MMTDIQYVRRNWLMHRNINNSRIYPKIWVVTVQGLAGLEKTDGVDWENNCIILRKMLNKFEKLI